MLRTLLALVGLLLFNSGLSAQEPKANALTPEEKAQGWILLFDGKQPLELLIDGDSEVVDGVLVIGGKRPSRVAIKPKLGSHFDLRLSYRTVGPINVNYKVVWKTKNSFGFTGDSNSLGLPRDWLGTSEWTEMRFTCDQGRLTVYYTGFGQAGGHQSTATNINKPVISFEVPAGTKFYLRNIKLKADPVSPDLLLPIIAGCVGVLAVLLLIFLIRLRRKKGTTPEENIQRP